MGSPDRTVLFVHGLWLHADSWTPWVERFGAAGYSPTAPGWPGTGASVEETRAQPEAVAGYGIADVVDHYARIVKALDTKPIVIGHSFGGLIAQRLLADDLAAAAVAIDPAPIKGVLFLPPSALRVASIALRNPANRNRAVSLTEQQFRYGFGNAVSAEESNDLYERWAIPTPGQAAVRGRVGEPLAQLPGEGRHAQRVARAAARHRGRQGSNRPERGQPGDGKLYRHCRAVTDLREFPDRGHSLTIDSGWPEVADAALSWLGERGL